MSPSLSLEFSDRIAVITIDSPPVNAISAAMRRELLAACGSIAADSSVQAVLLLCAGRTFIAGADISEFGGVMPPPELRNVLYALESLAVPVVVAIHGTALGGGVELALAGHYRIADKGAKIGFPEVTLGVVPGAVGTQRLPRLIGAENALKMFLDGKPLGAEEARTLGIIDKIVEGDLRAAGVAYAQQLIKEGKGPRRVRESTVKPLSDEQLTTIRAAARKQHKGLTTPELDIQAVRASWELPFEEGQRVEAAISDGSLSTPESKALRHLFFAEREVANVPGIGKGTALREIKSAGIIGSGTMGGGIAMSFANAGIAVKIIDIDQGALDRGMATVRKNYDVSVKRGRMKPEEVEQRMGLIQSSVSYDALKDVDLVVEAVFESMALKKKIFTELDRICKPSAILASNTSTLDINQIAAVTKRPQDVIGLHFFSPANVMRLLEIVRTDTTGKDAIASAFALAKKVKKIGVLSKVCYGFIGNRMMDPYGREAERLVLEGATPAQVDGALERWGMAMGLLAVYDMSGVDVGVKIRQERKDLLPEDASFYRASGLLFEQNWLGQKSGKGYYRYEQGSRDRNTHEEALALFKKEAEKLGISQRTNITDQEIVERCLYSMINEGALILEEGIALRSSDIDVVYTSGYGFPRWRGGPMHYADHIGLDTVLAGIEKYRNSQDPQYWQPAPLLVKLARSGGSFAAWEPGKT